MKRLGFMFKAVNAIASKTHDAIIWFTWRKRNEPGNDMIRVAMYTLSICPSCKKAKRFFADHHIPFEETNYDLADHATQDKIGRELEVHQVTAFPFVHIGEQTVQGYNPERYAELLGITL